MYVGSGCPRCSCVLAAGEPVPTATLLTRGASGRLQGFGAAAEKAALEEQVAEKEAECAGLRLRVAR